MENSIKVTGLLRCKDKLIVDQNDNPYLLRGFGLGGWLVKEGYMLHSVAASPTKIENAVIDLVGKKACADIFKLYEENYVNEEDIKAIASFGINSIRLPFSYKMLCLKRGKYIEEGFKLFDKVIDWCKKYNLYLILDMHCAPGSQNGQNISDGDIDNEAKLFTQKEIYQPWTIEIWQEIARRYVNEDIIAGYDLINEPVLPETITMDDLRQFYIDLTKGVREIDKRHIIFIEGNMYATNFDKLAPKWDDNMAYSFHKYWNPTTIESIKDRAIDLREIANAPIWMGESGENTNPWFYETIKLLEDNQIGWNWWTHKKVDNLTNPYSAKIGKYYQMILDYWHKNGPRPTKAQAIKGFYELVENLKLSNCNYFKDVVSAICDLSGLETSKPYEDNTLPKLVKCVNYDIGTNKVAYEVKVAKREDFRFRYTFNTGRSYRNDPLSIFKIGDEYVLGLFEDDSWVKYSLNSLEDETYEIVLTYKGSGKIKVVVNGQEKVCSLSSSSYARKSLGVFKFVKGVNPLYLHTVKNGLFILSMDVKKVA
jgi:hypothetical protein